MHERRTIRLTVPHALFDQLEQAAEEDDESVNQVVYRAIRNFLHERNPT